MRCPRCGRQMTMGAPHCESYGVQYECHGCGKVIGIPRRLSGDCDNIKGNPYLDTGFGEKVFLGYD